MNESKESIEKGREAAWAKHGPKIRDMFYSRLAETLTPTTQKNILDHRRKNDPSFDIRAEQSFNLLPPTMRKHSLINYIRKHDNALNDHVEETMNITRQRVENSVPHPKYEKKMIEWLASPIWVMQPEDIEMVGAMFHTYHDHAQRGRLKGTTTDYSGKQVRDSDFSNFTTYDTLRQINKKYGEQDKDLYLHKMIHANPSFHFDVVHEDQDVRVIHPKTHEAARYFATPRDHTGKPTGPKATWCTAGEYSHTFNNYKKSGGLLIFQPKNPAYSGELYQTHPSQTKSERNTHSGFLDPVLPRFPGFTNTHRKEFEDQYKPPTISESFIEESFTIRHADQGFIKGQYDSEADALEAINNQTNPDDWHVMPLEPRKPVKKPAIKRYWKR